MASNGPTRDRQAARLIAQLRTDRGLSPEGLSWAIYERSGARVSGRAIRYIEHEGIIPLPRTQFAVAQFFDRLPSQVWAIRVGVAA